MQQTAAQAAKPAEFVVASQVPIPSLPLPLRCRGAMLRSRVGLASLGRTDTDESLNKMATGAGNGSASAFGAGATPRASGSKSPPPTHDKPTSPLGHARRRSSTMSRRRDSTTSFGSVDAPPRDAHASSAWFDAPLVLALAPALGSLVTGGEHIRDFLLLLMMLYYLHQLIKVPWDLYNLSRPHRQHHRLTTDNPDGPAVRAQSELHALALFYLTLTVASPLLGGYLLRTISGALLGQEYISWFSTLVFVLAAGVRPWRHLVTLLRVRTLELQDVAHAGQPATGSVKDGRSILQRLDALEQQLSEALDDNDTLQADTEQLKLSLDRAEEASEKAVRRAVRKADADHVANSKRLETLEARLDALAARPATALPSLAPSILTRFFGNNPSKPAPTKSRPPTKHRRSKQLSRIPEEDELNLSDLDGAGYDSDDENVQPEWYERCMEVAFAPVRSLRLLFFFIVRLVRSVFFTDGHTVEEYAMSPKNGSAAFDE